MLNFCLNLSALSKINWSSAMLKFNGTPTFDQKKKVAIITGG